ncbi:hypothetical protein FACS189426_23000 [Bacteroidia bacterium]|nr:hypothetical protein FACS189426_23000 [Bacteroidia bacterium]GHV71362.1 hypothetical protein FACS189420_6200 [Bacteroidia bacterium]
MGKREKYIVDGAIIKCSSGNKTTTLKVTNNRKVKIQKKKVATMMDFVPGVNLFPMPATFGICKVLTATIPPNGVSKPCICACAIPWQLPQMNETIANFKPLLEGSKLICPIGGIIKINNVKQRLAGNKPKEIKCPKCKKDLRHKGHELYGTNERGDITGNLFTALKEYDSKISPTNHKFYRQREQRITELIKEIFSLKTINANSDLYLKVPDPIEGHHLICCEAVKADSWKNLFYQYCYNINCPQNGVLLPGDMLVACHFNVPLHFGNHGATSILLEGGEYIAQKNYVSMVEDLISSMKTKYKVKECKPLTAKQIKEFHTNMLEKSNLVFDEVIGFNWLITSDGMHYKGGNNIGCYDECRTLTQKRKMMSEKTGVKKSSDNTAQFVINITKAYQGDGCPRKRDHAVHGCSSDKTITWNKECRYDKKDELIENLED